MREWGWGVMLIAWLCLPWPGVWADADAAPDPEPADWPSTIARLQQQAQLHPGLAHARQQLATAYNNYGVSLGQQGQWELAARQLEEAIRLDDGNQQFLENLSNSYLHQAHDAYQQQRLTEAAEVAEKALALTPESAQAYSLLGEIEYARQRLKEAKAAWQRAVELDPNQPTVAKRLQQVSEELPVESKFERLSQASFDLRYEEQLERPVGFDIRDALLEARRSVGSDFAYWPSHQIVVLIYSAESFRALREETPEWVAGQFDGKIRVPLPSAQLNQVAVKQILFHEYTHALIHDLTSGACPTWLNEGLAEYEGRTQLAGTVEHLAAASREQRLIPWGELSNHLSTTLPAEEVALAYEQSYSIVAYLVERYGFWRIRRVLKATGEGQAWEQVLSQEYRMKPPRLEAVWREWLPQFLSGPR